MNATSRRKFLQSTGLLAGAATIPYTSHAAPKRKSAKIRNIIFCVSDGMNMGTLSLADEFALRHRSKPLLWPEIYNTESKIQRCIVDTASADSLVTDSAAAASAWGIGERCNNRAINTTPDGRKPTPLLVSGKQAGFATGLVSTARITHATPAGFAANVPHRHAEDTIAAQYLEREVDILLGGGKRYFDAAKRDDNRDLFAEFQAKGYTIAKNRAELKSAANSNTKKLLGTFSNSHLPYSIDQQNGDGSVPTLAEMTEAALAKLAKNSGGFILQVEGGRIDHAGHANDPFAIIHEQIAFDDAARVAYNFYRNNSEDTLLILTTDHGTGGCMLNGVGGSYTGTNDALDQLAKAKRSLTWFADQVQDMKDAREVAALYEKSFGHELPLSLAEGLHSMNKVEASKVADRLRNHLLRQTGVGWTSNAHTGELVEQAIIGSGCEAFPAMMKNYEVHHRLKELVGV